MSFPEAFHLACLREAIRLSRENVERENGGPFGAVIARDGEILGYGANAVTATNDPTAHAEIVAIRRTCARLASFDLRGATLYSSCEPCPMCLAAAYWARLDAVYFAATRDDAHAAGFDDAFLYQELALPVANRTLRMEALPPLGEEARQVFHLWQVSPRKQEY